MFEKYYLQHQKPHDLTPLPPFPTREGGKFKTNWRDDYHKKFADYVGRSPSRRVEMGIQEYWIVDYAALGSKELIGDPKQPTITIYSLSDEGEYRENNLEAMTLYSRQHFQN